MNWEWVGGDSQWVPTQSEKKERVDGEGIVEGRNQDVK